MGTREAGPALGEPPPEPPAVDPTSGTGQDDSRYAAFVSFSEKDKGYALAVQKYVQEALLRCEAAHKEVYVYLTDTRAGHLEAELQLAIERSDALIVICSPDAARSHWVAREISIFLSAAGDAKLFPLVVRGDLETSLPKPISVQRQILHDIRKRAFLGVIWGSGRDEMARIVAGIANIDLRSLIDWNQRGRSRRRAWAVAVGVASMALAVSVRLFMGGETYQLAQITRSASALPARSAWMGKDEWVGALALSGRSSAARAYIQKATEPEDRVTLLAMLVRAETERGNLEAARNALEDILREKGENPDRSLEALEYFSMRYGGKEQIAKAYDVFLKSDGRQNYNKYYTAFILLKLAAAANDVSLVKKIMHDFQGCSSEQECLYLSAMSKGMDAERSLNYVILAEKLRKQRGDKEADRLSDQFEALVRLWSAERLAGRGADAETSLARALDVYAKISPHQRQGYAAYLTSFNTLDTAWLLAQGGRLNLVKDLAQREADPVTELHMLGSAIAALQNQHKPVEDLQRYALQRVLTAKDPTRTAEALVEYAKFEGLELNQSFRCDLYARALEKVESGMDVDADQDARDRRYRVLAASGRGVYGCGDRRRGTTAILKAERLSHDSGLWEGLGELAGHLAFVGQYNAARLTAERVIDADEQIKAYAAVLRATAERKDPKLGLLQSKYDLYSDFVDEGARFPRL